ncbi:MAG: hypothetical protein NTU91_11235, partial [Chloroflexi bacterium]|nr:hypothetical protein [Chloroflexota bacterium]
MKRIGRVLVLVAMLVCATVVPAAGQTYSFSLDVETVDVYWQADGTVNIDYLMTFTNSPSADPMEYVDIGLPTEDYDLSRVQASIDGESLSDISASPYTTPGVAVGMGALAIPPGSTGTLAVSIQGVRGVMYEASDSGTVSVNFSPTWFGSEYVYGATDLTVNFHLPPGVQPEEPRWHAAPSGFPSEPTAFHDADGRIVYQWRNTDARADTQYVFGASFPASYVEAGAVITPSLLQRLGIDEGTLFGVLCCGGVIGLFALIIGVSIIAGERRKILISTIKKGGTRVVQENPLKVEAIEPPAQELRDYETEFVKAIVLGNVRERSGKLQTVMVDLVKAVQLKMKGFSLRETRDYYKSVMEKAWQEVEQASTPEVKSERFSESIEWTMLDKDFDDRTERTFRTGPVFLPTWWGGFSPTYSTTTGRAAKASPVSTPPSSGGGRVSTSPSLPTLPGANFAASVVKGVQNAAGGLVANVSSFTGNVSKVTNPAPVATTSSRSG